MYQEEWAFSIENVCAFFFFNSPIKEKKAGCKCVIAESRLLNEIFQFSMRGQQLFSYLRISAAKVTVKALTLSNFLRIFTACGVFFCFWLLLFFVCLFLFFCHLPPFSLCLSLSLVSFLFWQSSATDHLFFIRSEPFCSEMAYLYWSQQTDFTTVLRTKLQLSTHKGWFRRRRRKWKHSWSRSLEEDCFLLWYAFIILKRSLENWIEAL